MKQLKLNKTDFKNSRPFGGELMKKANGRGARPLATKKSMHLTLRSSQAVGDWSFRTPKNSAIVQQALQSATKKFGVKVYGIANSGNHLHIIIKLGNRFAYAGFIRALTGTLALKITGANKLRRLKKKFWDYRPYTRVIEWGKAFVTAKDYLLLNQYEAAGVFDFCKGRLKDVVLHPFGRPRPG